MANKLSGIADLIRKLMYADFMGKKNAKHRSILLGRIKIHEPGMKDRRMRGMYSQILPIGWCEEGIYVIDSIPEVDKMIGTETSRRDSINDKIDMLQRHRQFLMDREKEKESKQISINFPGITTDQACEAIENFNKAMRKQMEGK